MAQQVTLTIAESFNLAFEIWQSSSGELEELEKSHESSAKHLQHPNLDWVHFDDETELELTRVNDHFENINLRTYRRQDSLEDHQDLLICLH